MIVSEAFVLGLVATVLGIFGGIGVSRLIVFLFNQAGAGFPDTETVLKPRTFVAAAIVGLGVWTAASVAEGIAEGGGGFGVTLDFDLPEASRLDGSGVEHPFRFLPDVLVAAVGDETRAQS